MPSAIETPRFLPLARFFLLHKETLLNEPYRGQIATVWALYIEYCGNSGVPAIRPPLFAEFGLLLDDFNQVTSGALRFRTPDATQLEWINWERILIFQALAEGRGSAASQGGVAVWRELDLSKPPLQSLMEMLDGPLRTKYGGTANERDSESFDYDYERLWRMITGPTAMVQLSQARAKRVSPERPFHEICELMEHTHIMNTTFFNSRTLGLFNDIPSAARVTRLFQAAQGLIDKNTLNCIRTKIHYLPIITNYTDIHLGNCSYLDTCHKLKNCRYVHYFTMYPTLSPAPKPVKESAMDYTIGECHDSSTKKVLPAQWINCDVRNIPFSILGKFAAIISDPAWDIHMALPYGTCKDTELLSLPMKELQDEGIICLWVTGRSIEIGRRALALWGYTVCDEVIWIKTNQLNRTIVTGRTGHWFNHSKEHLLLGVKGNPIWLNRKIDTDFIVSGTRETLRKPDELYEIVERIVGKHARKLEIFGRDNNIRPGWVST